MLFDDSVRETHPTLAAAAKLMRQMLPRYASFENKQDAGQCCPAIDARPVTLKM